ncbi:EAL domain-containing protein [Comamonas sp. GB3 AK4-5]|uniref:EAL domain-containing protein n=1 Tax=Comamonas sp. GB3 AK4-5 TaxID=3231487 RepID=UPI00351DF609
MSEAPRPTAHFLHRRAWSAAVLLALLIPWLWSLLPLPPSLGQVLRLPALDWLQLPWLTSATLLVLAAQRLLPARALRPQAHGQAASTQDAYASAYRMLPDAAGISRIADGMFLDVNPAFCQLLGLAPEAVVGHTNYALQIYATEQERPRLLEQLQRQGYVDRMPINIQSLVHQQQVPGLISALPVRIAEQDCMIFVFHDTSEEQRTHHALQSVNRLLQQAGHLAQLGVWEDTKDSGLVYWSEVCFDIHGLPRDAPLPREYINTFVAPAWRGLMRDKIKQCLRTKTEWSAEIEIIRADGRLTWMRSRGEVILDEDGEITGLRGAMQDIDASKRIQESLRQSEVRFERIFEMVPTPMALAQYRDGRFKTVNPAWEDLFGFSRYECMGHSAISLGLLTATDWRPLAHSATHEAHLVNREARLSTRDGRALTVLFSLRRTSFGDGDFWLVSVQDISERKAEEERLRESEALISLTLSAASLGRWDWDLATGMIAGDTQWQQLNGMEGEAIPAAIGGRVARHWTELLTTADIPSINAELLRHVETPSDDTPFDATWRTAHGEPARWLRSMGKVVARDHHGRPLRMLGVTQDVTPQREQTHVLEQMAHFDALTGLANRVHLTTRLKESTRIARHEAGQLGVVYLDLDGFKPVNDRLGHDVGDQLLVQVAKRLKGALRAHDCVARLGGDEFVILLNGLESRVHCEMLLERIMQRLATPYKLGQETARITASMGFTLYPEDDADEDTLLRHADQAMYLAKQAGRNCVRSFDTANERQLRDQQAHSARIQQGLEDGEFTLFLQPKVDMVHNHLVGVEGLARWRHPARGVLAPSEFMQLVEGSHLDIPFGQWAVRQGLRTIAMLQRQGMALSVGVNISARQLQQPGFAHWLIAELQQQPEVPPQLLDLEITESAALQDITHVAEELAQVRAMGVTVSLDDFGTGYCSLTYLRQLPLDTLKIDQSFVHDMLRDQGNRTIIQGVTSLAASFGYQVVAEGVETREQCEQLRKVGCQVAQGYFFARPMPAEELPAWHAQWQAQEAEASSSTA